MMTLSDLRTKQSPGNKVQRDSGIDAIGFGSNNDDEEKSSRLVMSLSASYVVISGSFTMVVASQLTNWLKHIQPSRWTTCGVCAVPYFLRKQHLDMITAKDFLKELKQELSLIFNSTTCLSCTLLKSRYLGLTFHYLYVCKTICVLKLFSNWLAAWQELHKIMSRQLGRAGPTTSSTVHKAEVYHKRVGWIIVGQLKGGSPPLDFYADSNTKNLSCSNFYADTDSNNEDNDFEMSDNEDYGDEMNRDNEDTGIVILWNFRSKIDENSFHVNHILFV